MPDPYSSVQPGQSLQIPAAAWNRLMEGVRNLPATNGPGSVGIQPAPNAVFIRNDSGQDVERGSVLGVSGVVINPSDGASQELEFIRRPVITGVTPTVADHADRFVVMLENVKDGAFGLAATGGVFACKVQLKNTSHRFAKVKGGGGVCRLETAACGMVNLLWVQTGAINSDRWAVGVM